MGIFAGGKKDKIEGSEHSSIPRDIEAIKTAVTSPTNIRMSHVREPEKSGEPIWSSKGDESNRHDLHNIHSTQPANLSPGPRESSMMNESAHPTYAPIFVKIDRYRGIISNVANLKSAMRIIDNSLAVLKELERVREQTMVVIYETLDRVDQKLIDLDSDLVRPTGFKIEEPRPEDYKDVSNAEATASDLRDQIKNLKTELQEM